MVDTIIIHMGLLGLGRIVLHEVVSILAGDTVNMGDFVSKLDTVELVGVLQEFGPERCCDELGPVGQLINHIGDSFPVLSIQSSVDLVEQIERSRVALLDCEDECKGNK